MRRIRFLILAFFIASTLFTAQYFIREHLAEDHTLPVITFDQDSIEVSVNDPDTVLLQGVSAFDAKDGDLTGGIFIEGLSRFTEIGHRMITYAAFDNDGHVVKNTREVVYTDYESPRFAMSQPMQFTQRETVDLLRGVTVTDCLDGDITYKIKAESSEGIESAFGTQYDVTYSVSNAAGDTAVLPMTILVYDSTNPGNLKLNLTDYVVYMKKDSWLNPESYLKSFTFMNNEYQFGEPLNPEAPEENQVSITKSMVHVVSNVVNSEPGVYTIDYTLYTGSYNGTVSMTVVVEE